MKCHYAFTWRQCYFSDRSIWRHSWFISLKTQIVASFCHGAIVVLQSNWYFVLLPWNGIWRMMWTSSRREDDHRVCSELLEVYLCLWCNTRVYPKSKFVDYSFQKFSIKLLKSIKLFKMEIYLDDCRIYDGSIWRKEINLD